MSNKENDVALAFNKLVQTIKNEGKKDPKKTQQQIGTFIEQLKLEHIYLEVNDGIPC